MLGALLCCEQGKGRQQGSPPRERRRLSAPTSYAFQLRMVEEEVETSFTDGETVSPELDDIIDNIDEQALSETATSVASKTTITTPLSDEDEGRNSCDQSASNVLASASSTSSTGSSQEKSPTGKLFLFDFFEEPEMNPENDEEADDTFQDNFKRASNFVKQNKNFEEGMLLRNITDDGLYTYMHYAVFSTKSQDVVKLSKEVKASYTDVVKNCFGKSQKHLSGTFVELASTAAPQVAKESRKPTNQTTAFLVAAYKLLPEADLEIMDKTWAVWSGARTIYKNMPKNMGLKRLSFHKSAIEKVRGKYGFNYALVAECSNVLSSESVLTPALRYIDELKARKCGDMGLYALLQTY